MFYFLRYKRPSTRTKTMAAGTEPYSSQARAGSCMMPADILVPTEVADNVLSHRLILPGVLKIRLTVVLARDG